jgi:hypothetical protein
MDIQDLTVSQLKQAAALREQVDRLNRELDRVLGAPRSSGAAPKKKRGMSASVKKKIAAAQKTRWANFRRAKPAARSAKLAATAKKKFVSRATRAKLAARMKAYWAAKKAVKKAAKKAGRK